MEQIGQQPEQRAHTLETLGPCRTIRRIDLHDLDLRAFCTQQLGELASLVGHAAGRRWQWADEKDAESRELHHRLRMAKG